MSVIYSNTRYDTPTIAELRETINTESHAFEDIRRIHHRRENTLIRRYEAALSAQRPTYPTAEHREGIHRVAELIHTDTAYGDHLGYPRHGTADEDHPLPIGIRFESRTQRVNLVANAPYTARSMNRLWEFTADEITAFRLLLKQESLRTINEWRHDDGIGMILVSTTI